MHDTHLLKNLFRYLEEEEKTSSRRIKKLHVVLSEFGGMTKEHFIEHYEEASSGTRWEGLEFEFKKVPYGPELQVTKIEFRQTKRSLAALSDSRRLGTIYHRN